MRKPAAVIILLSVLCGGVGTVLAQQQAPNPAQAAPPPANAQQPQNAQQPPREGAPKWNYQGEQTEPGRYVQPGMVPSIPLEVEQQRYRIQALEDRVDRLEKAMREAIETINAQTKSIKTLSGQ